MKDVKPKSIEELAVEQLDPDLRIALSNANQNDSGELVAVLALQITRNTARTANEITTLCALYDYRTKTEVEYIVDKTEIKGPG